MSDGGDLVKESEAIEEMRGPTYLVPYPLTQSMIGNCCHAGNKINSTNHNVITVLILENPGRWVVELCSFVTRCCLWEVAMVIASHKPEKWAEWKEGKHVCCPMSSPCSGYNLSDLIFAMDFPWCITLWSNNLHTTWTTYRELHFSIEFPIRPLHREEIGTVEVLMCVHQKLGISYEISYTIADVCNLRKGESFSKWRPVLSFYMPFDVRFHTEVDKTLQSIVLLSQTYKTLQIMTNRRKNLSKAVENFHRLP